MRDGSKSLVIWAYDIGRPLHNNSLTFASASGNIKLMQWVLCNITQDNISNICCDLAAGNGHKQALIWLRKHKITWGSAGYCAAKYNQQEILLWLKSRKCSELCNAYCGAISARNIPLLEGYLAIIIHN